MKSIITQLLFLSSIILCNAQNINFPDANLKAILLLSDVTNNIAKDADGNSIKIDANNDGEIQVSEVTTIDRLLIYPINSDESYIIESFQGLEDFPNLREVIINVIDGSNLILQNLTSLEELTISSCGFQEVILDNLINLNKLEIFGLINENFNSLDFDSCNCLALQEIELNDNVYLSDVDLSSLTDLLSFAAIHMSNMSTIDISNNTNLESFNLINMTEISQLDFSQNINLKNVSLYNVGNLQVDFSYLENLEAIFFENVYIPVIDFSQSPNLNYLHMQSLGSEYLNLKNGTTPVVNFYLDGGFSYICADDNELDAIENFNLNNTVVNSYCSFTPGGDYYTVEGENKVDSNLNGCDASDFIYPNLKFNLNDGINTGTYISNVSGSYDMPFSEGTHSIIPVLENTDYFTVSPNLFTVNFPSETSPFNQNICVVPNGVYNDLEVVLIPLNDAVPGFDATYKIIYKNTGNTLLSGTVDFDYSLSSDYVQYQSSNPLYSSVSNNIMSWNYSDLAPFETREIIVTLNLNTPTDENFPLNLGDELNFEVSILPIQDEETPNNNEFSLKQIVVNAFDPNDIRCLEGENIMLEHVGEYVHYLIRYENLGTANATNIVVKNAIDITKFDINTLIPLSASHNFFTRINNQNDVEFIFENINLPFDDVNNDGYVVYKIKTQDGLVLGDEFANTAEIYFDFNAPVVTNTYSTEVIEENLGVNDYNYNSVKVYPNPANDALFIKSNYSIISTAIYDINGRLIKNTNGVDNEVKLDVSSLESGIYFIKVASENRNQTLKFVKN